VLQCVAVIRETLRLRVSRAAAAKHFSQLDVLQCVAVCCSVLQCVAVCCSVMQCVAVVRETQCLRAAAAHRVFCCNVLQCAAVCCSVFDSVAVCCSSHVLSIFEQIEQLPPNISPKLVC